jgi:putative spermidine/putrescine transport system permease protein
MTTVNRARDDAYGASGGAPSGSGGRSEAGEVDVVPRSFKIVTVIVMVLLLLPIFVVVLMGLNAGSFLTFPPQGFSTRWIENFLSTESLRNAFLFSLQVALLAALIATTLGTMVSTWLVRAFRERRRAVVGVSIVLLTPVVLPGISIGFALFLAAFNLGLRGELWLLVLVHAAVSLPFAVIVITATLYQLDPELGHAARSLGESPFGTFRRVTLPLAIPGISAGFLFSVIISFGQTGLSIFLVPPNESTLPLALYFYLRFQFDPTPAAAGVFSIVLVLIVTLLLNWLTPIGRLSAQNR